jgi:hypothetical protein
VGELSKACWLTSSSHDWQKAPRQFLKICKCFRAFATREKVQRLD